MRLPELIDRLGGLTPEMSEVVRNSPHEIQIMDWAMSKTVQCGFSAIMLRTGSTVEANYPVNIEWSRIGANVENDFEACFSLKAMGFEEQIYTSQGVGLISMNHIKSDQELLCTNIEDPAIIQQLIWIAGARGLIDKGDEYEGFSMEPRMSALRVTSRGVEFTGDI